MKPKSKKKPKKYDKCLVCNETFWKRRKWQKFCSKSCKNKNFWKTHKIVKADELVEVTNG